MVQLIFGYRSKEYLVFRLCDQNVKEYPIHTSPISILLKTAKLVVTVLFIVYEVCFCLKKKFPIFLIEKLSFIEKCQLCPLCDLKLPI